jgi:peptidyl-prolyl cis-trans isomerase SurA
MKQKSLLLLLLLLLLGSLQAEVLDRIVAKIGNEVILYSDLQKQIAQMRNAKMLDENYSERDVLNEMVESRLIVQRAKELNFTVSEDRIRTLVEKQMRDVQANFKTEEAFYSELRKSGLTRSELVQYFTNIYTEQQLKDQIINSQIKRKVKVSDRDIRDYYDAHKADLPVRPEMFEIGMIMRQVHVSPETRAAKKAQITAILEQLRRGADFETLAKKESDDTGSAAQGGDLGFFGRGMMVKPFEDAAFALKPGEISGIVETQFGYHIIQMEEKNPDEIRVRHILKMLVPDHADTLATKVLMDNILTRLQNGASFAEMAKTYSEDDSSAVNGGVIGEYNTDSYPELFKDLLTNLPLGQYSTVQDNGDMFYIFAKLREIPARAFTFNEIKPQITEMVTTQKQLAYYRDWIEQLKKTNFVEIKL